MVKNKIMELQLVDSKEAPKKKSTFFNSKILIWNDIN